MVNGYDYAPIIFARICKAGKCVGEKFAGRYYDAYNYGVLLYPDLQGADPNIVDHTSLLPAPLYDRITLDQGNTFSLSVDSKVIFTHSEANSSLIEQAIVAASQFISLRIGDFVAIELKDPEPLCTQGHLQATYCDNPTIDIHIK